MKRFISAAAALIAAVMVSAFVLPLAACGGNSAIKVTTMGGLPLNGVVVDVYRGDELISHGVTDENGEYRLDLEGGNLYAEISNLPAGYVPNERYPLNANSPQNVISVNSSIITDEQIPANKVYALGDIMYDFEIANAYRLDNGQIARRAARLSDIAEGKKAVIINFFYTTCGPCNNEMPHLVNAYNEFSDDIAMIGISDWPQDSDSLIQQFVASFSATYDMGMDSAGVARNFGGISGYPTTYMIDRYGVICERVVGGITNPDDLYGWIRNYISDDYSQDIGDDENGGEAFTPDLPSDFNVSFTDNPEAINNNSNINATGSTISFSADRAVSAWPWEVRDDMLVPTNSGHRRTTSILYARLNVPANKVVSFDYRINCEEDDYFYVAVDARDGMGHQTIMDTARMGAQEWKTGYAYIGLNEPGTHELAFIFYESSDELTNPNNTAEDMVYIKNIRLEDVSTMVGRGVALDMPYFAARGLNRNGGYDTYENVELGDDGYYHVSDHASSDGDKPILFAAMQDVTPFFDNAQASIYNNFITQDDLRFPRGSSNNLYNEFASYNSWASNSDQDGLVPVTERLRELLTLLYNREVPRNESYWSENGWLEFCAFFKHFGAGESIGSGIEGLAYFSALEAHETTGMPNNGNINQAEYDKVLLPMGYLFKFVPETSGVYKFTGIGNMASNIALYDDSLETQRVSVLYASPINTCTSDFFPRNRLDGYDYDNVVFEMYQYLESGKTYYANPTFNTPTDFGTMRFRIDKVDSTRKEFLTTVTSGLYTLVNDPELGNIYRIPVYVDTHYDSTRDLWLDSNLNKPIYCDFTSNSRMFNRYSIGQLLGKQDNITFARVPFDFRNAETDASGNVTYSDRTITINGEEMLGTDYTDVMKEYYDKSVAGKLPTDDLYGLVEVDDTLRKIIMMFYNENVGFDDYNEWLLACWYYDYVDAAKPIPNTATWRGNN